MADGHIVFETAMDNRALEKALSKTKRDIEALKSQIESLNSQRNPLAEQARQYAAELDEAKMKLAELEAEHSRLSGVLSEQGGDPAAYMEAYAQIDSVTAELQKQQAVVDQLQKQYDKIDGSVESYDSKIKQATTSLETAEQKAAALTEQLASAADQSGEQVSKSMDGAASAVDRFNKRVVGLIRRIFVFNLLTRLLNGARQYIDNYIKSNDQAAAAIANLRGAFATLAQPILSVVVPALVTLINIITKVVYALAQLFAMLTGGTVKGAQDAAKSFNQESKAIGGAGKAADKASKSMANFDEINQLSGDNAGAAGGGGAGAAAPTMAFDSPLDEGQLNKILKIIQLIGSALAAWKIGKSLGLNFKQILGLALAIYSAIEFVKQIFDAWVNGVTWENLNKSILALIGVVVGLYIAFGPLAAGIALIVGGVTLLVTAFHDAAVNGWNLQNTCMAIAGILAAGMGIAVLTTSWIPLLIAGIAAILLALVVWTGHGQELIEAFQEVFEGFKEFFCGVFTGDFTRAVGGLNKIFEGFGKIVSVVIQSIQDAFNKFLDWLDEKTHGKLHGIIEFIRTIWNGLFSFLRDSFETFKQTVSGLFDAVMEILTGVNDFLEGVFTGNWKLAWEGVKSIVKGVVNTVISLFEGVCNLIVDGINFLISGANFIIGKVGGAIGLDIQIPKIEKMHLPRLAQGAVIPPNREFMAVLGDQKSGTNIETPLDTMVTAFRTALADMNAGQNEALLVVDGEVFGRLVYKLGKKENRRIGVSLVEGTV